MQYARVHWVYVLSFGLAPVSKFGITSCMKRRVKRLARSAGITGAAFKACRWKAEREKDRSFYYPELRLDYAIGYRERASAHKVETWIKRETRDYELFDDSSTEWRRLPPHEMIAWVTRAIGKTSLYPPAIWTCERPVEKVPGVSFVL